MPRRNRPPRRETQPDVRYGSVLVARFINKVMQKGKKSVAARIVYDALDIAQEQAKRSPLEVMEEAVRNVSPVLEVKPRRVGGSTYQVPVEIRESRREALAMRWLIQAARVQKGKAMSQCLANELFDAFNETGTAVKKKEDTHRMAEANKAFSHYRW